METTYTIRRAGDAVELPGGSVVRVVRVEGGAVLLSVEAPGAVRVVPAAESEGRKAA
jgi:sRNA-binding carbon storage regulator CsrA